MDIAKLIPDYDRRDILERNVIFNAQPYSSDLNMHQLLVLWKVYIEPGIDFHCGVCITRILENWRGLQNRLIELENEHKLLGSC